MTISNEQVITAPPTGLGSPSSGLVKPTGRSCWPRHLPRPVAAWWPATEASRSAVLARVLAAPFTLDISGSQQTRRLGVLGVLSWLGDPARRQLAATVAGQRRAKTSPIGET